MGLNNKGMHSDDQAASVQRTSLETHMVAMWYRSYLLAGGWQVQKGKGNLAHSRMVLITAELLALGKRLT